MRFLPLQTSLNKDVNDSQGGEGRLGGVGDRNKTGELGTVVSFDASTYAATVKTERGRVLPGIPCLRSTPGDISPLPAGTEVLISYDYGPPIIMGCLSMPSGKNTDTPTVSVSDAAGFGGQGLNKTSLEQGNYRRPGEPTDLMPGDWAKVGGEGQTVALLGGGTALLKSSPLAQIRTHLVNDLVEIFSRNFRHVTDMGELNITNDEGRINLSFRGASDQRNEAGPDEEKWTIRADLGAVGDIFNFEFTTPKGQTLFKFHVDASGHCEIYGVNGVNVSSGSRYSGVHSEEHTGNSQRTVGGTQTTTIGGGESRTIGGTVTEQIAGNYECSVNNDWKSVAIRDIALNAGRTFNLTALGPVIPLPGSPGAVFDIENGGWEVTLGSPITVPLTADFSLTTHNSNISHTVIGPGNIDNSAALGTMTDTSLAHFINTNSIPESIVLGAAVPIGSHIAKYEQLLAYLEVLHGLLDAHVHQIPSTAVAGIIPVTGVTANPVIPFTPLLTPLTLPIMSVVAKVSA